MKDDMCMENNLINFNNQLVLNRSVINEFRVEKNCKCTDTKRIKFAAKEFLRRPCKGCKKEVSDECRKTFVKYQM
jgi:hypothetical protein